MYLNKIKVLYFSLNYLIGFTFSTFNTSDENLIKKMEENLIMFYLIFMQKHSKFFQ